jgi:YegS/Rv2252/BmrU family lipid kinase
MEKILAILNPAAGGGTGRGPALKAVEQLRESGLDIDLVETTRPGEAREIARTASASGGRNVISLGGDGTAFEVVNGLFDLPRSENAPIPTLGFIPIGTGNSFLRDFTDEGAKYAVEAIRKGRKRRCDILRLTHKTGLLHFINIFSIGFAAEVAALRNRRFSALGEFGYVAATVGKVATLAPKPIPIRVDGGPWERDPVTFLSINNTKFTGGKMMMAPEANSADGRADLIRVAPMGRMELLKSFPRIFQGTHLQLKKVTSRHVRSVEFDLDRDVDVQIDGDSLFLSPQRLDVLPSALEIRV